MENRDNVYKEREVKVTERGESVCEMYAYVMKKKKPKQVVMM